RHRLSRVSSVIARCPRRNSSRSIAARNRPSGEQIGLRVWTSTRRNSFPVRTSQQRKKRARSLQDSPLPAAAKASGLGARASALPPSHLSRHTCLPVAASHRQTVPSSPPVASDRPSGERATPPTALG